MDNILNDVLNSDEHNANDDSDKFNNKTHEEANDTDVEIIISTGSAHLRRFSCSSRDHKEAGDHANQETSFGASDGTQPQTNSFFKQ